MANIRAYDDGERLIVVIDHPSNEQRNIVAELAVGICPTGMQQPPAMKKYDEQTELKKIGGQVREKPKFVEDSMRTIGIHEKKNNGTEAKSDTTEKRSEKSSVSKPQEVVNVPELGYIGLCDYLKKQPSGKIRAVLWKRYQTADLDYVLSVKSEREIQSIALQL